MVAGTIAGNISPEATKPFGNIFADATRGLVGLLARFSGFDPGLGELAQSGVTSFCDLLLPHFFTPSRPCSSMFAPVH